MGAHKTQEFIAALHVIAAGEASEERQKVAVQEVFARYLNEVNTAVRGDPNKVRSWVADLQKQLKAPAQLLSHTRRFALLRAQAQELVARWLQDSAP